MVCTTIAAYVALHLWWNPKRQNLPAPASVWPVTRSIFLASRNGDEATHCLYLFDLGGVGEKMRKADLILAGTSHAALGLSAGLLSTELSTWLGRPVHVYNIALGHAEGWGFTSQVLQRNRVGTRPW